MPSDDPISALQALSSSDDRQRSPVQRYAKHFLNIIKLFAPPGTTLPIGGVTAVVEWLAQRSSQNISELVDVIAEELKVRGGQIDRLKEASDEHRHFIEEEMPGLILDSMVRAENLRTKDRIAQLARILVHAAEVGHRDKGGYVEEMLRIATNLDARDVRVLREIVRVQGPLLSQDLGRVKHFTAHNSMRDIVGSLRQDGFIQGEVDSICAKLESFGLVSRTERNVNLISDDPTPYALLRKGLDFVEYIKSAAERAPITSP
ncbi:MAG TPA: hypothetical protein VK335_06165 [Bryobacteraceae bacterium]|nr:hypothetical protein [Bryobacteraceae bacterium]